MKQCPGLQVALGPGGDHTDEGAGRREATWPGQVRGGSGSKQAGQEKGGGGGLRITVKGTPEPSNRWGWAVEGSGASEPLRAGCPYRPPSQPPRAPPGCK